MFNNIKDKELKCWNMLKLEAFEVNFVSDFELLSKFIEFYMLQI